MSIAAVEHTPSPSSTSRRRSRSTSTGATGASTPTPTRAIARRPDPQRLRQGHRQLLAQPRLPARSRRGPPRGRLPHPRPRHVLRLLRRLVAAHAAARGLQRRARQGRGRRRPSTCPAPSARWSTSSARCRTSGPARRHSRRFDTYLAPFVRKDDLTYDAGAPVHPGARLQPQRAVALGHADAVHQPHLRLDLPGGPARAEPGHRRRGDALHLRRAAGRDGHDQPGLHRGDDRRATPRAASSPSPSPPTTSPGFRLGHPTTPSCCSR